MLNNKINYKKIILKLFCCVGMFNIIILGFLFSPNILADSGVKLSLALLEETELSPGEEFTLGLFANSNSSQNISAFRIKLKFAPEKLIYKGLYSEFGTFKTYLNDSNLVVIFITNERGIDLVANETFKILELNFKVDSSANLGTTNIEASVDGLGDFSASPLSFSSVGTDLEICQAPISDCNLNNITVNGYDISPKFSPEILQYYLEVPYTQSSLEIEALAQDSGDSVKINRKTLYAAGNQTNIKITVTSSDKKSQKVYTLTVNRLSKEATANKESSSKKASTTSSSSQSENGEISSSDSRTVSNSESLIVKEGNFNFWLFFIVIVIIVIFCIFIVKNEKILSKYFKKNKKNSDSK